MTHHLGRGQVKRHVGQADVAAALRHCDELQSHEHSGLVEATTRARIRQVPDARQHHVAEAGPLEEAGRLHGADCAQTVRVHLQNTNKQPEVHGFDWPKTRRRLKVLRVTSLMGGRFVCRIVCSKTNWLLVCNFVFVGVINGRYLQNCITTHIWHCVSRQPENQKSTYVSTKKVGSKFLIAVTWARNN